MNMWALIQNGTVSEVTDIDPAGRFHPSLVWVEFGADVKLGWTYDGGEFSPPIVAPEPVEYPRFTALEMLSLFTETERRTVVQASMSDVDVKMWYDMMIAANYTTYEDPRTESGLQALVDAELLTPQRKAEIVATMRPRQ